MDKGLENIRTSIDKMVNDIVHSLGIECRVFCRIKDQTSLINKIHSKEEGHYSKDGKKVQDIIGVRIVTYFYEDVDILWNIFAKKMNVVDKATTEESVEKFTVQRKNMVCRMNQMQSQTFFESKVANVWLELVDDTFEIQFRTVSSEGWHEIDHLLKYKCKEDWLNLEDESRTFNGIYATLETSDRALKALFDDIAHKHYHNKQWEAMLRMKYKLSFMAMPLSENIKKALDNDKGLAKAVYRTDRVLVLNALSDSNLKIHISFDNIVFLINRLCVQNKSIFDLEPMNVKQDLDNCLGK